jgi:hypothetical protein
MTVHLLSSSEMADEDISPSNSVCTGIASSASDVNMSLAQPE